MAYSSHSLLNRRFLLNGWTTSSLHIPFLPPHPPLSNPIYFAFRLETPRLQRQPTYRALLSAFMMVPSFLRHIESFSTPPLCIFIVLSGSLLLMADVTIVIMLCVSIHCSRQRISNTGDIFLCFVIWLQFSSFFHRFARIKSRFSQILHLIVINFGDFRQTNPRLYRDPLPRSPLPTIHCSPSVCLQILFMSDLSPKSPLSIPTSSHGSSNSQNNISPSNDAAQAHDPNPMAGSWSNSPRQPFTSQLNSYAHAVILGMKSSHSHQSSSIAPSWVKT